MELPELAWPAVAALPKTTPVVFPIAALEQHGKHMPVFTDSLLLGLTYWDAAGNPSATMPNLVQKRMGHACEWETSMVLRLNPKLVVGDVTKVPEIPHGKALEPGHRAWVMPDRSEPGHIGTPAAASAEKGEGLFAHFAGGVSAYLERVAAWNGREWDA